jgi:hypothetical protein
VPPGQGAAERPRLQPQRAPPPLSHGSLLTPRSSIRLITPQLRKTESELLEERALALPALHAAAGGHPPSAIGATPPPIMGSVPAAAGNSGHGAAPAAPHA